MVNEIAAQIPGLKSIEFENAFYADDGHWIESLSISSGAPFDPESALSSLSRVELFHKQEVSPERSDRTVYRLTIVANEPYPFLLGVILQKEGIPNRLVLRDERFDGAVTVKEWTALQSFADGIQKRFGQFELVSVNQVDSIGEPFGSGQLARVLETELSDEQLRVLETAYSLGYFDVPRAASAEELASELDIAQSTLSERLRIAEKTLFGLVFEPDDTQSSEDS